MGSVNSSCRYQKLAVMALEVLKVVIPRSLKCTFDPILMTEHFTLRTASEREGPLGKQDPKIVRTTNCTL